MTTPISDTRPGAIKDDEQGVRMLGESLNRSRQDMLTILHRASAAQRRGLTAKDYVGFANSLTTTALNILSMTSYIEEYLPDDVLQDQAFKSAIAVLKDTVYLRKLRARVAEDQAKGAKARRAARANTSAPQGDADGGSVDP